MWKTSRKIQENRCNVPPIVWATLAIALNDLHNTGNLLNLRSWNNEGKPLKGTSKNSLSNNFLILLHKNYLNEDI
jgi:hypothetical protein